MKRMKYSKKYKIKIFRKIIIVMSSIVIAILGLSMTKTVPGNVCKGFFISRYADFKSNNWIYVFDKEAQVNHYIENTPDWMLNLFYNQGGSFSIDESSTFDYAAVTATYNPNTITVRANKGKIVFSSNYIIHEIGHFIDRDYGYSQTPTFTEIVSAEGEAFNICNLFCDTAIEKTVYPTEEALNGEYFVEALRLFYAKPKYLKCIAPQMYNYINEIHVQMNITA